MLTYNLHAGSLEAYIDGKKNSLLKPEDYTTLCQCETLADLQTYLAGTDYGQSPGSEKVLTPRTLLDFLTSKTVEDFREIRLQATQPLAQFLDFISYEHMIGNVLKMVMGTQHGKDTRELLARCHPLGYFPGMEGLALAHTPEEVFEVVLIDSPLAQFFLGKKISVRNYGEMSIEVVRNILYKNYLEAFAMFCEESLNDRTQKMMAELLGFKADRHTLSVTLTSLNRPRLTVEDRLEMMPSFGTLADVRQSLAAVDSEEALKHQLRCFPEWLDLFDDSRSLGGIDPAGGPRGGMPHAPPASSRLTMSLERRLMEKSIQLHKYCFLEQFQYGVFAAYFELKDVEVSNITWIAECISQSMRHRIHDYAAIF